MTIFLDIFDAEEIRSKRLALKDKIFEREDRTGTIARSEVNKGLSFIR